MTLETAETVKDRSMRYPNIEGPRKGKKNVVPYLRGWEQKASYDKNIMAKKPIGIWAKTLQSRQSEDPTIPYLGMGSAAFSVNIYQ